MFKSLFTEGALYSSLGNINKFAKSIVDKNLPKAVKVMMDGWDWGNYRLDMGDIEMTTSGFNDDIEDGDTANISIQGNNKEAVSFNMKDGRISKVKIKDLELANIITQNLVSGNFKEPRD